MTLRYKLEEKVGSGRQGDIYRGRLLADGRRVAVKSVRAGGPKGERLAREAEVLARLPSHRNVRGYLDVVVLEKGEVHLVQEWVEGEALDRVLEAGQVPIHAALYIIHEVLTGLSECVHAGGVVHRDLSPANILIGEDGSVRLADFGIAKSLTGPKTTGSLRGTPGYLSPEQARRETLSTVSDLFTVGVLFYELLTGRQPIEGTETEVRSRLIDGCPVPSVRSVAGWVPDEIDNIIAKLLAKDPAQRYQTAAEVLADVPKVYLGPQSLTLARRGLGIYPVAKYEAEPPLPPAPRTGWLRSVALGAAAVMGSVALVAAGAYLGGDKTSRTATMEETSSAVTEVGSAEISLQHEEDRPATHSWTRWTSPARTPPTEDESRGVCSEGPAKSQPPGWMLAVDPDASETTRIVKAAQDAVAPKTVDRHRNRTMRSRKPRPGLRGTAGAVDAEIIQEKPIDTPAASRSTGATYQRRRPMGASYYTRTSEGGNSRE